MKHTRLHIIRIFTLLLLLLAGGTANEAWAAKVTYHILTLPIDNTIYKMKSGVNGKRLEAVKIIVDNQTTVELPAHYKSPLAENFTYYEPKDITGHGASAESLYDGVASRKGVLYTVKASPTPVAEGAAITGSTAEYYVVYTYKTSNTIAKLDGTVNYNIGVKGKGFLSLNRGRNNRPAVIPTAKVDAVMLASEDFSYVANPGNGIGTYWSSGDNKNIQADVESQFFFWFKFVGQDPYNIIIRTSYNRDITFIEKNEGTTNFVYKWYKGAALMAKGDGNVYLASDDHKQYTTEWVGGGANPTNPASVTNTGYFHGNDCTWGTVALLNNTSGDGYVLLGTRTVDGNGAVPTPGNDNKYNYLTFNGSNNMNFKKNTAADATKNHTIDGIYPLKKVTFKVVTPFYKVSATDDHIVSAPTEWVSQYTVDNEDIDTKYLPTSLLRKYCTYTGFYRDPACTQEITKFSGANYDEDEGYQVYIGYEVSANIPFKAITPAASYTDDTWKAATWYAMTDRDSSGKKIKWDSTNSVYKNNGGASENVKESEFAFIGDPYELRVVYRNETSGATATYVGSDSRITETDLTKNTSDTGAGYKWEISYDEETKNNAFQLREYKGTAYWYWNTEEGSNIQYSTTNTDRRIRVLPLPEKSCNFYIVDRNGTIAIKATANRTVFSPLLGYASIPEEIRSPFIYDETITFYSDAACTTSITETSNTDNYNIYVKYTLAHLSEKGIQLNSEQRFKVKLNKEYIYYNSSSSKILSAETTGGDEYSWSLEGGDPYAMKIANKSLSGKYVKVDGGTWGNDKALTFVDDKANGSPFIAMSSLYTGIYEVLAATGDANYYHIGRPTESGAETRIYSVNTAGYAHGSETLQFELSGDVPITYHLIDRADNELLTAKSYNPRLTLPAEYVSPLVEEYYYYPTRAKATTNNPAQKITEIAQDTDEDGNKPGGKGDYDIYVTYVANDIVNFNKGQYMLKFLDPAIPEYHLEDGNDKLTASKIQPIYPYCNGDGNLNIYGDEMQTEQFGGGANTRPRWVWYFESSNSDPYHVRIHSKSTISYNGVSHYTYLTTHAVHFNQDTGKNANKKRVVTGGTLPTIASITPTEYMVLGTKGNYRLLTTNTIDDGETNVRRNVTSLEQYWKTYNMVRQDILGDPRVDKDDPERFNDPITMPSERWSELKTKLETKGVDESANRVDGCSWHSYKAYANATRWNGYNDKSNGYEKKVVENIEHWYQTFDMGTGVFDIETADIPPVLVLLDRHGWEVMRRPLPGASTYPAGDELKDLRMYDSPLVDKYYFYSNATKASGCHKYTMRMQNGAERDQVKVNGERYYSTSLGDLPPKTAVVSGGAIQDLYVIYTVKEEYENNYTYSLDENTSPYTESGTSKPYLVLQHGRFYKTENSQASNIRSYFTKPIREHTNPEGGNVYDLIVNPKNHGGTNDNILSGSNFIGNIFWYVEPNLNIDDEMGIPWMKATGEDTETAAKNKLRKDYKDKTGFDPYNIQLRLKNKNDGTTDGRYLTTHMTSTTLNNGIWMGEYNSMTATDVTDVETQAKKLSKTGNYYFKQKDAETYWYVNVKTAYDGTNDATYDPPTSGSYATEWTQQSYKLTLEEACTSPITSEGYDHSEMQITNQTFMAVSDVNGNMQLMPRFDHTKRVHLPGTEPWHTTLSDPEDHALASVDNNASMGPQTTFFVTPQRFHYHIIDNNGREALRYKRGADTYPTITDHFKSPIAKDFTYYSGLAEHGDVTDSSVAEWGPAAEKFKRTATTEALMNTRINLLPTSGTYYYQIGTRGSFTYKKVEVTKGLEEQKIDGSFAAAGLNDDNETIYVRYKYDEGIDSDGDNILGGKWFTIKLNNLDVWASGTINTSDGTGVLLYAADTVSPTKPGTVNASAKTWQWKFLQAPTDPSSEYYTAPDPYAIELYNRSANYSTTLGASSPMSVPIKVNGTDRFSLLSHPDGGYALAVNGLRTYTYSFLNGASMTTSVAATTAAENTDNAETNHFTIKSNALSAGAQLIINDDVTHDYTYNVINNAGTLAVKATQDDEAATVHSYAPYLPEAAQTPLLNDETDYLYYGSATETDGVYSEDGNTELITLYGLYDDLVYVRYHDYDANTTPYLVPNEKAVVASKVARGSGSNDVAMNISGGLPYNIIWEDDNMMRSTDDNAISDGGSQSLSGTRQYVWYFTGDDPYALKIQHKGGKYANGTTTMVEAASAQPFMLLKKEGYDYGILQVTGTTGANAGKKLTGFGGALTADASTAPTKFIIFGLSVHKLFYHLIIAKSCPNKDASPLPTDQYVDIPYMENESGTPDTKRIYGTTQRDLTTTTTVTGDTYQLGTTLAWGGNSHIYSYDAGTVSIGDKLEVPSVFYRANCDFDYYIEGVYNQDGTTAEPALNNKYKGLKLGYLMSDADLIDKTVVVNIVYGFTQGLETNAGDGFVTSVDQNLWYTFVANAATPKLAQYTGSLQTVSGYDTHYTNDYLWTPLGDPYGFKMYNRYMHKNLGQTTTVMTTTGFDEGTDIEMRSDYADNSVYELLADGLTTPGYFYVHPVANNSGTQYYMRNNEGVMELSETHTEWTYGLSEDVMRPYYDRAGYVGGLNEAGKAAYEDAIETYSSPEDAFTKLVTLQGIVYNHDKADDDEDNYIVHYTPGYYRLHNQPGSESLSTLRYASGYLHDIEKTAGESSTAIPMHFYSRAGITGTFDGDTYPLESGFTVTNATQGDIPIPATEYDPSTIFYFSGSSGSINISTQGLNVLGNKMTTSTGTPFTITDIGGAIVALNGSGPTTYLRYDQSDADHIYDLSYTTTGDESARWCMQPAANQGLKVTMNDGGDGYYYSTFYAPFDVLLPDGETYAYVCNEWNSTCIHPTKVPVVGETYAEGKFVPAGSPVIFRTTDTSGSISLTLPNSSPSSSLSSCVFTGQYLEQMLAVDASHDVYTFGLPFTSSVSIDRTDGSITAALPEKATTGVGFYINATPNKEADDDQASWQRNNRYVLHNKIYYRAGIADVGGSRQMRGIEFVPVVFGDDLEDEEQPGEEEQNPSEGATLQGDGCIYDLMGRKVATRQQVEDGSWRLLRPGIYILNGKKFRH